MASEPPDPDLDDASWDAPGRFRRSCLTLAASIGVASSVIVGCTALTLSKLGDFEFDFDFDLSGLEGAVACMALRQAETEPDPARAHSLRVQALQAFEQAARSDPTLADAIATGPDAVDLWCTSRGYA